MLVKYIHEYVLHHVCPHYSSQEEMPPWCLHRQCGELYPIGELWKVLVTLSLSACSCILLPNRQQYGIYLNEKEVLLCVDGGVRKLDLIYRQIYSNSQNIHPQLSTLNPVCFLTFCRLNSAATSYRDLISVSIASSTTNLSNVTYGCWRLFCTARCKTEQ